MKAEEQEKEDREFSTQTAPVYGPLGLTNAPGYMENVSSRDKLAPSHQRDTSTASLNPGRQSSSTNANSSTQMSK